MDVVLESLLWIQVYVGPVLQVYVTLSEQRDHSPECARTPHQTETACNHHWKACSLLSSLCEFLRCPEYRDRKNKCIKRQRKSTNLCLICFQTTCFDTNIICAASELRLQADDRTRHQKDDISCNRTLCNITNTRIQHGVWSICSAR